MRVFVAGATGVIGRRVVPLLVAAGHRVSAVARGSAKAEAVSAQGADPIVTDLFDPDAVAGAVAGHEAVVNLATRIPSTRRMVFATAWRENDRLRREASTNLVDAALASEAGTYVQESIGFLYDDHGAEWIDEEGRIEATGITASALAAEGEAERFTRAGGRGVVLRFAQFVAADSEHTRDLARTATRGWLPLIGAPEGFESFVHVDDAARAVVAAVEVPAGVYNVVEDRPLTRSEHAAAWSRALGRNVRLPPAAAGRLPRVALRARSQRLSNRRLRGISGWRSAHPDMRAVWTHLVAVLGLDGGGM